VKVGKRVAKFEDKMDGREECNIQSDFECCADFLTCDKTPQKVTIEPMMPYTNVDIFREKWAQSFSKKVWEPLNFIEKWVKNKS
jgi:hypothetical protein